MNVMPRWARSAMPTTTRWPRRFSPRSRRSCCAPARLSRRPRPRPPRFDGATGAFIDVFASGGGIDESEGIGFGPDGNLYVVSESTDEVFRYDGVTGDFIDIRGRQRRPRGAHVHAVRASGRRARARHARDALYRARRSRSLQASRRGSAKCRSLKLDPRNPGRQASVAQGKPSASINRRANCGPFPASSCLKYTYTSRQPAARSRMSSAQRAMSAGVYPSSRNRKYP